MAHVVLDHVLKWCRNNVFTLPLNLMVPCSETPSRFDQPLLGAVVIQAGEMGTNLLGGHGERKAITDRTDGSNRSGGVLKSLAEQSVRELVISFDSAVKLGCVVAHQDASALTSSRYS